MSQGSLRVVARLQARPEKADELRELLLGLIAPTRAEGGCVSYELLENKQDPGEFTFVEEWRDPSAFAAHFDTDHIKAAVDKLPDLLASELDVRQYTLLG